MKLYDVKVGRSTIVQQLDEKDAKRLGDRAKPHKKAEPQNKSRSPQNKE